MVDKHHLGVADYMVIGSSLLIASSIGIWFRFTGNRQSTTIEYLMAGRNMSKIPVILSATATMLSALTMIGTPIEIYRYGFTKIIQPFATLLGTVLAAYLFIPVYFECGVSTIYEFLEIRYGKQMRYTVSLLFVIQMVIYMSCTIYAPVLALSAVTDLSPEMSTIIIGSVCTFYCMLGGLKAVLWTDVFQVMLMSTFMIILYVQGITEAGGMKEIFRKASEGKRLDMWKFSLDMTERFTVWNVFSRGLMFGLAYYGTSQVEVQRMLSLRNAERARSSLVCSAIPTFILFFMSCFTGLIMYGNFYSCDPIKDTEHTGLKKYDQVIPYYIVTRFSSIPGLTGLCISGVFSGSLSTISSVINSLSTVTVKDLLTPLLPPSTINERRALFIAKFLSFAYGMICIGLTFALRKTDSLIAVGTTLSATVEGPIFAVFLIAVITRKGTQRCGIIGLLCGAAITTWIGYGSLFSGYRYPSLPMSTSGCSSKTDPLNQNSTALCPNNSTCFSTVVPTLQPTSDPCILYKISYVWIPWMGFCLTLLLIFLISLATGCKDAIPADSKCLSKVTHLWRKHDSFEMNNTELTKPMLLEKTPEI